MAKGDHLRVWRVFYYHNGIDVGDGTVIHFVKSKINKFDGEIGQTSIQEFASGNDVDVYSGYPSDYSPDEIVERAKSFLGLKGYNLIGFNCEHFVHLCRNNIIKCSQVSLLSWLTKWPQHWWLHFTGQWRKMDIPDDSS